ncbi:g11239 [Coccomyxa viridis]|uniref:G11239 protein n=1 Tax=Coccomyxa viridis TaxID=1274662 RepID=A0ABP1GC64_9CHLO
MDIKSLSAEEIKAARERLASRKSFFGGSVSTREEAAAPDYKIRAQTASKAPQRVQTRPEKPRGTAQQARKPAAKRPRATADDFGDLDDYNDQPSKPYTAVNASKAGDMWGQYLAAQRKKEDAQHVSATKQMHAGRNMQSRPPVSRAEPRIHDHRTVVPGTDKQRPLGTARGFSAKSSSPVGRKSHTARPFKPGGGLRASATEEEDDLDGFIDDDLGAEDWRSELQAVTGYDPSKYAAVHFRFAPVSDNVRMVASRMDIEREERQSKRLGRLEDVKAEEEERRLRALKEAKREKHRPKSRKGSSGLLLD